MSAALRESERPIRLGYVGAGEMAQRVHLPNFSSLDGCQVAALAEARPRLGREVQRRYGVPKLYPDHRALAADPDVDAVAVSAPYAVQGEIARDCLLAGKPVFMEKPMAVSLAQADRILAAERTGGARLMVAYMKRYDAGNQLAHRVLSAWRRSGEVGSIRYARAHGFCGDWLAGSDVPLIRTGEAPPPPTWGPLPEWLPAAYARRYVEYLQQYTHNVNLLRFLLDSGDDARVTHVDLDPDGRHGVALLALGGVRCVLETGQLRYHRWDEHTQVYFERGWVHTWAPPLLQRNAVAEVEIYRAAERGAPGDEARVCGDEGGAPGGWGELGVQHTITRPLAEPRWTWAYRREAQHFVECLRSGAPFGSSGQDTRTDVRLFEDLFRTWLQA